MHAPHTHTHKLTHKSIIPMLLLPKWLYYYSHHILTKIHKSSFCVYNKSCGVRGVCYRYCIPLCVCVWFEMYVMWPTYLGLVFGAAQNIYVYTKVTKIWRNYLYLYLLTYLNLHMYIIPTYRSWVRCILYIFQ